MVDSVVRANLDLLGKEGKLTAMASVHAREAYFGEEVMAQCTARGYGYKPGLNPDNNLIFEEKGSKCLESISSACKRARAKPAKK